MYNLNVNWNFEFQYKGGNWWLGASDKLTEGTWTTNSSGSPQSYFLWNKGEPNGGTSENCVVLVTSSGKWYGIEVIKLLCH